MVATTPQRRTRVLKIRHATTYRYDRAVARSSHKLHLRPIQDAKQTVRDYALKIETMQRPHVTEFEDVFGNCAASFEITTPYQELLIQADSVVEVLDVDPFEFVKNLKVRPMFPLVWMPWELKMLQPYLTPQELPDTQLAELYDYAMSFVKRNNNDLLETLFDINLSLFREYAYTPGFTTFATTAFDVMGMKKGVCQDFANLFITLARMLSVPARYVCGYIYTGNTGEARARSDATHAWVQLYIPNVGWKGFDPTNGVLPHLDHMRVGYGRNYRDVTPTTGTLYTPANETMTVDVEVGEVDGERRGDTETR